MKLLSGLLAPRRLVFLPVAGVALGSRIVAPGVSAGDLALALFLVLALPGLRRDDLPAWSRWLLAFVAFGLLATLGLALGRADPFSIPEALHSGVKLLFYASAALVLAATLRRAGAGAATDAVLGCFALAGLLAALLHGAMLAGLPLPHRLLWGSENAPATLEYDSGRWFGTPGTGGRLLRAQGLAGEPSRLGYLQGMALGLLLLGRTRSPRGLRLALVALGALLSASLTAAALVLPSLLLRGARRPSVSRRLALAAVLALGVVLLPAVRAVLGESLVTRPLRVLLGETDFSARVRIEGSLRLAAALAARSPLVGVGLGQFDVAGERVRPFLFEGKLLEAGVQGWNALAHVLATTGLLGLALFLALLCSGLRLRPELLFLFLVGAFVEGTVLGPAFWVFLALFAEQARPASPEPARGFPLRPALGAAAAVLATASLGAPRDLDPEHLLPGIGWRAGCVQDDRDRDGKADLALCYGFPDEPLLAADFDGDGIDELAVRRGRRLLVDLAGDGGGHELDLPALPEGDQDVLADWIGSAQAPRPARLAVRHGARLVFDLDGDGEPDREQDLGIAGPVLAGRWTAGGPAEAAVVMGRCVRLSAGEPGQRDVCSATDFDEVLAGDWDGDGRTDLLWRRGACFGIDTALDGRPATSLCVDAPPGARDFRVLTLRRHRPAR